MVNAVWRLAVRENYGKNVNAVCPLSFSGKGERGAGI